MFFRNKHTKRVVEISGSSAEGRAMAKADSDWDKIDGPTGVDEDEQMPAGVQQPPEPAA